jgi:hypothetical protein
MGFILIGRRHRGAYRAMWLLLGWEARVCAVTQVDGQTNILTYMPPPVRSSFFPMVPYLVLSLIAKASTTTLHNLACP